MKCKIYVKIINSVFFISYQIMKNQLKKLDNIMKLPSFLEIPFHNFCLKDIIHKMI